MVRRAGGRVVTGCLAGLMTVVLVNESAARQAAPVAPSAEKISIPDGDVPLGSVRLPTTVMADGKRLRPGTYSLRLTGQTAAPPDVVGALAKLERWVEFRKGSEVVGRAVASIVPGDAIKEVAEGAPPKSGTHRVERLKGGDYLRIWVNKGGDHVLLHLPLASGA